jgi:hypothetical protein
MTASVSRRARKNARIGDAGRTSGALELGNDIGILRFSPLGCIKKRPGFAP